MVSRLLSESAAATSFQSKECFQEATVESINPFRPGLGYDMEPIGKQLLCVHFVDKVP